MDIKSLSDAFGGCIFGDSLRISLIDVRGTILQHERTMIAGASGDDQAASCLHKAVYNVARGDFTQALVDLQIIEDLGGTLSQRWVIRREAYRAFIVGQQRYPHNIRFRPNANGAASIVADVEHNVADKKDRMIALQQQVAQSTSMANVTLELRCLQMMTFDVAEHLALQPCFHQAYPNNIPNKLRELPKAKLLARSPTIDQSLLEGADASGLHVMSSHFRRLNVETLFGRGDPDAVPACSEFFDECARSRNGMELALTYIMYADHLISPPATSPLALNLITEGTLTGYEIDFWDQSDFETARRLGQHQEASRYYDDAYRLLQRHGCVRGLGAICLRRACILHMGSFDRARSGHAAEAMSNQKEARSELDAARRLFELDVAYSDLTRAHQVLLHITTAVGAEVIEEAKGIGDSCRSHGNIQLSRFIGTLMLRFGRRRWLDDAPAGTFLLCCQCAQACARASGDKLYEHEATIAIVKVHHELGSIPAAQAALDAARISLAGALNALARFGSELLGIQQGIQAYYHRVESGVQGRMSDSSQGRPGNLSLNEDLSPEYRAAATKNMTVLANLRREYTQAVAEGQAALTVADLDEYYAKVDAFSKRLLSPDSPYDLGERSVAGFYVMAQCLIGRYEAARLRLPSAISSALGGIGQNKLFDDVLTTYIDGHQVSLEETHEQDCGEQAIAFCVWAQDWAEAARVLAAVQSLRPQYLVERADERQRGNWQAQAEIGTVYEHNDGLVQALKWYLRSVRTLEKCRAQTMDIEGRLSNMRSMNSAEMFAGLVRVALRLYRAASLGIYVTRPADHQLRGPNWCSQALFFAEQSRARLLLDMLSLSSKGKDTSKPPGDGTVHQTSAFETWTKNSYAFRQYEDLLYNRWPAHATHSGRGPNQAELNALEREIQQQRDGDAGTGMGSRWSAAYNLLTHADFLYDFSTELTTIPEDTLVLHCNTFANTTVIFALTNQGISRVREASLTHLELIKYVLSYQKLARDSHPDTGFTGSTVAAEAGGKLAEYLIQPFEDLIDGKQHVIFVPSQELFAYPLCSLPYRDKPLVLHKRCSTVTSLTVLRQLRNKSASHPELHAQILVNQDSRNAASAFGAAIASCVYGSPMLSTNSMTRKSFANAYRETDIVYFATHGREAPSTMSPWQADILLDSPPHGSKEHRDPQTHAVPAIRVIDLADFRTSAAVIVFGACVTAKGHTTLGNDIIGFSHAVLASGARCFIGALWSVSDWATMLIMMLFHSTLVADRETKGVAECLQVAQKHFYELNVDIAVGMLRHAVSTYDDAVRAVITTGDAAYFDGCREKVLDLVDMMEDSPNECNFTDPYYWAGWTVVGHGDVCVSERAVTPPQQGHGALLPASSAGGSPRKSTPPRSRTPKLPVSASGELSIPFPSLTSVHSVDVAGLPTLHSPPRPTSSPPPPQLPSRPLAVTPQIETPSPSPPPLPPRRPLAPPSMPRSSRPPPQRLTSAVSLPAYAPQSTASVVKRRPIGLATPGARTSPPPAYSSSPSTHHLAPPRAYDHPQSPQRPTATSSPGPPLRPPVQQSQQSQHQLGRLQGSYTRQSRPVPKKHPALQQRTASQPIAHSDRLSPGGKRLQPSRQHLAGPGRQPIQKQQVNLAYPADAQAKASPMEKLKTWSKTPTGKRVVRRGAGMLVASFTGGLLGAEVLDWGGGGGDDGEFDGGGDSAGYDEVRFENDNAVETFEDDMAVEAAGGEEEYAGGGFGEDDYGDGEGDYDGEEFDGFGDEMAHDGSGEHMYADGDSGVANSVNEGPAGQVGSCFEDNLIVSAGMPGGGYNISY